MTKGKRYRSNAILAMQFCWSASDLSDQRYQDTRTTGAVYNIGDDYYCCVPLGKKPYQDRSAMTPWDWKPVESDFANGQGFQIWKASSEQEAAPAAGESN